LVDAGCFDFTGWTRDELCQSIEPIYESALKEQKDKASGFMNFFTLMGDTDEERFNKPPRVLTPTPHEKRLFKEKELLGFFLTGHPMDKYKDILKKLSCHPFTNIEEMPHDMVFRAAFIIETVQIRFASKTQKKFAILTVSDGYLSFELPVWADLYEEKSALMKENQLVYAVLQVDKRDEALKLSARWLDDLSRANEEMIAASDQAYDKAKAQALRMSQMKSREKEAKPKMEKEKEKPVLETYELKLDVSKVRHSHILKMKNLFEKHRGQSPVQMNFYHGSQNLASIDIESRWGVKVSDELKKALIDLNIQA
jgi:DNA polymerase-3 subunit alpha